MTSINDCFDCQKWADGITKFHAVAQLELGRWARALPHIYVHYYLERQFKELQKAQESSSLDQWTTKRESEDET